MNELLAAGGGAAALVTVLIFWLIAFRRRINHAWGRVRECSATLDRNCRRRADLVPKLVALTRDTLPSERDRLTSLRRLRARSQEGRNPVERRRAEADLSHAIARILSAGANSPALNGRSDFEWLNERLVDAENAITHAEEYYDEAAHAYNSLTDGIAGRLVAGESRAVEAPEADRQAVS